MYVVPGMVVGSNIYLGAGDFGCVLFQCSYSLFMLCKLCTFSSGRLPSALVWIDVTILLTVSRHSGAQPRYDVSPSGFPAYIYPLFLSLFLPS